ncbi:MAG TPA: nucleotide-binding protein [Candidatus Angelobacter sp.]|nr:nucleotide-binding protein [Candidatus Angelobacter sp.]
MAHTDQQNRCAGGEVTIVEAVHGIDWTWIAKISYAIRTQASDRPMNNRAFSIFVGSSSEALPYAQAIAGVIQEHPLFEVIPWWEHDMSQSGDSFFESLFRMFRQTTFAIFVATPDDLLLKRGETSAAIRDNILFEYGLFAGYLGRHSAILVQIGESEVPSDLRGIQTIRIKPLSGATPIDLRKYLLHTANRCIEDLLRPRQGDFELVLSELRDCRTYLQPDSFRPLLAKH